MAGFQVTPEDCERKQTGVPLRHSREIDRFCSPRVTHHCTRMVQFARVQNRVRRAAIALPGQALPLLAVARFHHGTRLTLGNSACYEPLGADDEKPTRAPCADDIVSPLPCQIVFFAWVSDPVTL